MSAPTVLPRPWPKRPARLGTAVVNALVDQIVAGEFPPGTTLPIEPDLCETFGVSRTVLREAVKSLEEKMLVRVRQGHGTTVAEVDDWDLLDPHVLAATVRHDEGLTVLDELVEVRAALESQMALRAATCASEEQLARLADQLATMATLVPRADEYLEADLAFHDAIMLASQSRLGRAIVRTIHSEARSSKLYHGDPGLRHCAKAQVGHEAIYQRLLNHDADEAALAMSEHIRSGWQLRRKTVHSERAARRKRDLNLLVKAQA